MMARTILLSSAALSVLLLCAVARAQDVPGIEICTVEKTMERRTSCLQSNVEFLHKTITRLSADDQQKLDVANRQIEGLKTTAASLQKALDELQVARKKEVEDHRKVGMPPPDDALPAKEGRK
jgi:septal ring factor EnvC (AmiA/AmiB activator)